MNKYCIYLTDGRVAFVTANHFDWGYKPQSETLWFYDDKEDIVAYFSDEFVIGITKIESEIDTNAV